MRDNRALIFLDVSIHFIPDISHAMLDLEDLAQPFEMAEQAFQSAFSKLYAPQTKILEGGTRDEMMMLDVLFNGSWPKLSTHALEKCFDFRLTFQLFVAQIEYSRP